MLNQSSILRTKYICDVNVTSITGVFNIVTIRHTRKEFRMKQYRSKNGKVIVTELSFKELDDKIKELEDIRVLEDTYCSEFNDDYLSIRAEKLS